MADLDSSQRLVADLRDEGIADERVLSAMVRVPREKFVDRPFVHAAYDNTALPIACGQTISQPYVVALMTQALAVGESMRVLEVGTGSGYQAAVLSQLCRRVYSIERHRPLLAAAEDRFRALGLHNITTRHGDGREGWPEQAPFDRILVTAAASEVPKELVEQLKPGGILVIPVAEPALNPDISTESICQRLTKMIRTETGLRLERLIPVVFVPLVAGLPDSTRRANGTAKN